MYVCIHRCVYMHSIVRLPDSCCGGIQCKESFSVPPLDNRTGKYDTECASLLLSINTKSLGIELYHDEMVSYFDKNLQVNTIARLLHPQCKSQEWF